MASSGKKGKKNKGTVISLQSFLSNGETPSGTTQVAKKFRNVDGDDSDEGNNLLPLVYQLPTGPRANRIYDDDTIPHKSPFIAYVTNLPFDVNEDDIYTFFVTTPIISIRLPREDGDSGRVRGFGYVEFETRDDLIHVLSLPDPSIKGRRIRIDLSNESDQHNNKQKTNRRAFDGFGNASESRESTNWRKDNVSYNFVSYNNNRKNTEENMSSVSWRTGNRSFENEQSSRSDRQNMKSWDATYNNKHNERIEGKGLDLFSRKEHQLEERPKLNLKPRTLPLPEVITKCEIETSGIENIPKILPEKISGIAPQKVFGSAKPVDTAARELEIEERLAETRRQEKLKIEQDQANVSDKMSKINIEKTDKENTNSTISWRKKVDLIVNTKDEFRKFPNNYSVHHRNDNRQQDNREKDINRCNRNRDKNERSEAAKVKIQSREGKQKYKDDNKTKHDLKSDRPLPKYHSSQSIPVLQSTNKYSGLDDEASE